uniref:Uncharacterized protein n=1 Tax=Oryza brachyantha TaxID=4533 RepID=J3MTM9_ORYBR
MVKRVCGYIVFVLIVVTISLSQISHFSILIFPFWQANIFLCFIPRKEILCVLRLLLP